MAQYYVLKTGEGEFAGIEYGLIDEANPAPEGSIIVEASTIEDALSLAELEADDIMSSIDFEPEEEKLGQVYNIWALAVDKKQPNSDPRGLDYKTGLTTTLHPKLSFVKGELLRVEYYKDYDGKEFENLILDVDVVYNRSSEGVLTDRITTRKWTIQDGFGTHVKTTKKFYSITQAAVADQRRRSNIVDNLVAKAHPSVVSFVKTMFRSLDNEINSYKTTGDTKLIEKIGGYDGQWLDAEVAPSVTLRMAIIGQLTV